MTPLRFTTTSAGVSVVPTANRGSFHAQRLADGRKIILTSPSASLWLRGEAFFA